jgi:tetratricopeptide (TPR) repeat protein
MTMAVFLLCSGSGYAESNSLSEKFKRMRDTGVNFFNSVSGYVSGDALAKEFEYYVRRVVEAKDNLQQNKDPGKRLELEIRYADAVREYQDFAPVFEMKLEGLPTEEKVKFMKKFGEISNGFEKKTAPQTSDVVSEAPSSPRVQSESPRHTASQPEPGPTPALRETSQEAPEKPRSPTGQPSAPTRADEYVQLMIRYAMNGDVVDSEAKILGVKRDIEALNLKSQVVQRQRKKAREANDRDLQHLRRWEVPEAVQAFRTAAEVDPADIEVINNLGHAYTWQDDLPRAEKWLLRTLTMAPGRSYAWADLGQVYAKQGDVKKGVACFANAYRFARNQDASRRLFQELVEDENQHAAVREAARQVLQLRLVQAQH